MTPESMAARAETLAIAEALERRVGCSALVLKADIERAAAELRCLSAENTAAVSAFLAADDERRELRAERDALQRKVQEMALQALADDTQHREVEAERDALLEMLKEARQMVFEWGSNAQDLFDLLPQDLARIDAAIDAAMKGTT